VPRSGRLLIVLVLLGAVIGVCMWTVYDVFGASPPQVDYAANHAAGQPIRMTIEADPTTGTTVQGHTQVLAPSVTYMFKKPTGSPNVASSWVHSTIFDVPAHTRIDVTAYEFDTGDALRNQLWGKVEGTIGGTITIDVGTCRGDCGPEKPRVQRGVSVINSNVFPYVGHTFSFPGLGLSIPLKGMSPTTPVTGKQDICPNAPCLPATHPHTATTFSFVTPSKPGTYRWQCFIPCGYSYFDGNGGPMATIGYMTGFMRVL
jgi:hypothetical protein